MQDHLWRLVVSTLCILHVATWLQRRCSPPCFRSLMWLLVESIHSDNRVVNSFQVVYDLFWIKRCCVYSMDYACSPCLCGLFLQFHISLAKCRLMGAFSNYDATIPSICNGVSRCCLPNGILCPLLSSHVAQILPYMATHIIPLMI